MDNIFESLSAFVDRAEKMGKYPANSAASLKSTIKIAAGLISDEEPREVGYLREHAEEIFARSRDHSSLSIRAYIARLRRLLDDYQNYGVPASAMLNWKTTPRATQKRARRVIGDGASEIIGDQPTLGKTNTNVLSLAIREGVRVRLDLPPDLSIEEADRICVLIRSMATFGKPKG